MAAPGSKGQPFPIPARPSPPCSPRPASSRSPWIKFHVSLKKLPLHKAKYVLLQAVLLFSPDHTGITQQNFIDQFQKVAPTLKSYIDHQHPMPEGRFPYAKLLLLLTELQTLKVENTRQIVHIQDLSSTMPLFSEIS